MTSATIRHKYKTDPEFRESLSKRSRQWQIDNKDKHKVNAAKSQEVYRSRNPEKTYCRGMCKRVWGYGHTKHHWSYNRCHAKDIVLIDKKDHYRLHHKLDYDESTFMFKTEEGRLLDTKDKHIEYIHSLGIKTYCYKLYQDSF